MRASCSLALLASYAAATDLQASYEPATGARDSDDVGIYLHVIQTTYNESTTQDCEVRSVVNKTTLGTSTCYKGGTAWFKVTCDSTGTNFIQRVWNSPDCTGNVGEIPGVSCPVGNATCVGCYPTSTYEEISFTCQL